MSSDKEEDSCTMSNTGSMQFKESFVGIGNLTISPSLIFARARSIRFFMEWLVVKEFHSTHILPLLLKPSL